MASSTGASSSASLLESEHHILLLHLLENEPHTLCLDHNCDKGCVWELADLVLRVLHAIHCTILSTSPSTVANLSASTNLG